MFYNAMRSGGVSELDAKMMYAGVWGGGPRWEWRRAPGSSASQAYLVELNTQFLEGGFDSTAAWIQREHPTVEEIEQRVDSVVIRLN